jgi:ribosome-binding protein aMBF1 (putative translation factor)
MKEPALSTDLLRTAAEAIYGPTWQACLARRLSVSDRTVRRWASGESPVPRQVGRELNQLCEFKKSQLHLVSVDLHHYETQRLAFEKGEA